MIKDLGDMFGALEKFDITMEQFMLPYILFLDQREYEGDPLPRGNAAVACIYRYSENVRPWPRASIQELVDKGLLENYNEDETVYPDNLDVTDKFAEAVFATTSDFERFWDAYPSFAEDRAAEDHIVEGHVAEGRESLHHENSQGGAVPLKASVKAQVKEQFEEHVLTKRDFNELMEALAWAKKRGMIRKDRMDIETFIGAEYWTQLRETMA